MFNTIQSLFQKPSKPEEEYPGLKMKFQVYSADYGIGKVMATCNTKAEAIKTIQQLVASKQSYTIREVLVSAD
jgi:hypothetical protein